MVTLLWTGSDRFGHVKTGVKRYFSSTMSCTLSKFGLDLPPSPETRVQVSDGTSLKTLRTSEVVETALRLNKDSMMEVYSRQRYFRDLKTL